MRVPSTTGVEVAAYDLGGDGPPLLFAHATGFHGHVWAPLFESLRDAFHGFTFDERGHGDSTSPEGRDFDWRGFADDVLAVIDGFGLDRPFAVGHSGGGAAVLLAEIVRPGTFRALYCFEPIVFPPGAPLPHHDNPLSESALRRREVFASRDEAYANFAAKPPFSVLHPDALRAYVDRGFDDQPDGTVRLKCHREDEAEVYRMAPVHDTFDHLGEVRCPVTMACGGDSDTITPAFLAVQAEPIPAARIDVLEGLGHFAPLEDPAQVAASIRQAFAAG